VDISSALAFLNSVVEHLRKQVEQVQQIAAGAGSSPVSVHGLVILLRLSLESMNWNRWALEAGAADKSEWQFFFLELVTVLKNALQSALKFHFVPDSKEDSECNTVEAVDCRGHLILSSEESKKIPGTSVIFLVVNSWLAVKEISAAFASLVSLHIQFSLFPLDSESQVIESMFKELVDVLLKTKHNGTIQKAHVGLHGVCKALLASKQLKWWNFVEKSLDDLLEIVFTSSHSWIRRSAGLPFCFLAIPSLLSGAISSIADGRTAHSGPI